MLRAITLARRRARLGDVWRRRGVGRSVEFIFRGLASSEAKAASKGSVVLTERSANRIKALREKRGGGPLALRLAVEGGGCSGFSYVFDVTEKPPNPDDVIFEAHGERLIVDETSLELIDGSKVDFTEDLLRRSFEVVNNPNAESACGCGSSFAAKMSLEYT